LLGVGEKEDETVHDRGKCFYRGEKSGNFLLKMEGERGRLECHRGGKKKKKKGNLLMCRSPYLGPSVLDRRSTFRSEMDGKEKRRFLNLRRGGRGRKKC